MRPIERFRDAVRAAAREPAFVHHGWYAEYHLDIVARLAEELCGHYPQSDTLLVQILVWLHDYGKIVDREDEHATTLGAGAAMLRACGFDADTIARALAAYERFEDHASLATAPIEVQIVSSADGAAHLIGPFYAIWWHEHPERPIATLLDDNRRKALFDWERKITLSQVRTAFVARHRLLLEDCGAFPARFLAPPPAAVGPPHA